MAERDFNVDMNWDPQADIVLKGYEWEDISRILAFFQNAMMAYNAVVGRHVSNGTIKVRYVYTDDGSEVPPEVVQQRQAAQMREYEEHLKSNTVPKDSR